MLGDRLKKAIEQSGKDRTEVANFMGVSIGNLYKLFKKETFEWEYIRKASEITGFPISFFIEEDSHLIQYNQKSADNGNFGGEVLSQILEEMKTLREQLNVKDRQIDKLQDMLNVVLGKSNGASRSRMVSQSKSKSKGAMIPFFENQTKAIVAQI